MLANPAHASMQGQGPGIFLSFLELCIVRFKLKAVSNNEIRKRKKLNK